jgi:hypothetical protein
LPTSEKDNVSIVVEGESRQRLDLRFDPKTIAWAHSITDQEKQRAREQGLPEPKLTWIVERAIQLGLAQIEGANKERNLKEALLRDLRDKELHDKELEQFPRRNQKK